MKNSKQDENTQKGGRKFIRYFFSHCFGISFCVIDVLITISID